MSTVVKDLGAVSAYAYAVEKGYTGTEAEFAELMADYAEVGQRAEDAADSALESKTAAQTAATTATNKASEATTAATTATNKAAEAQADADAAALDASQALSAASTATTKATEATTAAATATSAATTATTAKDDAVSAKTAAQTAQTGAETAAASVQSSAEQIATNAADISQLKSDYVAKNGENQVQPQNIAGVTFDKEEGTIVGENLFLESYLGETGYYAEVNTSVTPPTITHGGVATMRWYAIPVDGNAHYTFTEARFAFLAKGNTIGAEAIGTTQNYLSQIDTTADARFLILSYWQSTTSIEVHKVTTGYIYSNFVMPEWMTGSRTEEKNKYAVATGNIASGGNLQLTSPRNNLRKGERIIFEGNITSFDTIRIGLSFSTVVDTDSNQINTFRIDGTNISYYARSNSTPVTVPHGLSISGNIQIIWEMSAVATCKITLISDGNLFVHEFTNFVRQAVGNPFVLSDGTVLTDCKLTWACNDIDKSIWMFGNSYFQYSENRWTYYLHQYGYDQNCLLDGFPGEGGTNGRVAFNNLLQFGTPKYAVWCLGMNDGSDSDSAPATDWVTNRDYFLQYCQDNNVTPIFGTIPTVPTINHEQKNAWIRSSGYRYIDFAKAVGATSSGTWFSGMLSSDGVHPTAQGARALFARVLLDLPEIMIGGYGTPTAINS